MAGDLLRAYAWLQFIDYKPLNHDLNNTTLAKLIVAFRNPAKQSMPASIVFPFPSQGKPARHSLGGGGAGMGLDVQLL